MVHGRQLALWALLCAAGCGDSGSDDGGELVCPDAPVARSCFQTSLPISGDGPYRSAADFTMTCAGAPAPADLSGVYTSTLGDFALESCPGGYGLRGLRIERGSASFQLHQDDSGLLLRREIGEEFVLALLLCGDNGDGSLEAVSAVCTMGDCVESPVTIDPFVLERPNGEPEASGLRLVAEHGLDACGHPLPWFSFVSHVEYQDDIVYLTATFSGLHMIDVSDPAAPVTVGSALGGTVYNDLALFDVGERRYAVVADFDTVPIFDVTDPARPRQVSEFSEGAHRLDVRVADDGVFAYLASFGIGVAIYDITDPSNPSLVGTVNDGWDVHAPIVAGDKLYVAAGSSGFAILDDPRADPDNPVIRGTYREPTAQFSHHAGIFEVAGTTYALHNDEVGVEPWFKVIDVTPGSPTFLQVHSEYVTLPEQFSHNVTMDGTTGYLAYYEHGVRVLDVSDPSAPVEQALFHTFHTDSARFNSDGATDIAIDPARDLLFVANSPGGLVILELEP